MQRVKRSTAVAILPADPVGGTPGFFATPDPGGGVPATVPGNEWYNNVQEEICYLIEANGGTLSGSDRTQIYQSVKKMVQSAQRAVIINNAVFAPAVSGTGKAVYWDSANSRFDLALADGSAKQNCVGFADAANANVYAFGDAVLFSGLTPGARYYLDGTTAGAITATAPTNAVFVGIARNSAEIFVDVDATSGSMQQAGEVCYFARSTAPTGFLKANGAALSRTTYANLFTAIGTTFGVGDGSTTFNLPDLRGEFLRGWDDSRGVDSARAFGSLQNHDFLSHTHPQLGNGGLCPGGGSQIPLGATASGYVTGAAGGTETRPRNVALLACIKF